MWYHPPGQNAPAAELAPLHHAQPSPEVVLGGQGAHAVRPSVGAYVPGAQLLHAAEPGAPEKVPSAQGKHFPAMEAWPAGHTAQDAAPGALLPVPAAHARQLVLPASGWYCDAMQGEHSAPIAAL